MKGPLLQETAQFLACAHQTAGRRTARGEAWENCEQETRALFLHYLIAQQADNQRGDWSKHWARAR